MKGMLWIGLLAFASAASAGGTKNEAVRFYANARVVLDGQGVPQQVVPNERLPKIVRDQVEQRLLQWRFEPARVDGQNKAGVTYVFLDACAVPQVDGGMRMALDYRSNGPALAGAALVPHAPRYPADAARSNREGSFRVMVNVGTDGLATVGAIETRSGSLKSFEKALRDWVASLRYVPEEVDGRPVATQLAMPVDFSLGGSTSRRLDRERRAEMLDSAECRAVTGQDADPERPVVLDSPFKPITTG